MKKALWILIFLFSTSFAIEEKSVKRPDRGSKKPKTEEYHKHRDKDDDGIWDTFIKNILRKSEKKENKEKKDIKLKKKKSSAKDKKEVRKKRR
jgi:hypothetical protein